MQNVVVARRTIVTGHFVTERTAAEQRRVGLAHVPVHGENAPLLHQTRRGSNTLGYQEVEAAEVSGVAVGPYVPSRRKAATTRQVAV